MNNTTCTTTSIKESEPGKKHETLIVVEAFKHIKQLVIDRYIQEQVSILNSHLLVHVAYVFVPFPI